MKAWSISDKGIVRRDNQDAFFAYCDETRRVALLIVCDGMGGAAAGCVASQTASSRFSEEIMPALLNENLTRGTIAELLRTALDHANEAVYSTAISDPEMNGMGTTMVAALITDKDASFINVGDSRAYHISKRGITQITRDHSLVVEMLSRGDITPEQEKKHPNKNVITRAVGTSPNVVGDIFSVHIRSGDYLLLCSDGLTNLFTDNELLNEIRLSDDPETCCRSLLRQGIERGAPDNITIVLFKK